MNRINITNDDWKMYARSCSLNAVNWGTGFTRTIMATGQHEMFGQFVPAFSAVSSFHRLWHFSVKISEQREALQFSYGKMHLH